MSREGVSGPGAIWSMAIHGNLLIVASRAAYPSRSRAQSAESHSHASEIRELKIHLTGPLLDPPRFLPFDYCIDSLHAFQVVLHIAWRYGKSGSNRTFPSSSRLTTRAFIGQLHCNSLPSLGKSRSTAWQSRASVWTVAPAQEERRGDCRGDLGQFGASGLQVASGGKSRRRSRSRTHPCSSSVGGVVSKLSDGPPYCHLIAAAFTAWRRKLLLQWKVSAVRSVPDKHLGNMRRD